MLNCGSRIAVAGLVLLAPVGPAIAQTRKADVLFVRGRIYQPPRQDGSHLDCSKLPAKISGANGLPCESHSYAEALAVKNGKVVAVGDTRPFCDGKVTVRVVSTSRIILSCRASMTRTCTWLREAF